MDKSIMAMADDILGGALSNPAKAQSQLSNPYNEPELPELSDTLRENMMNKSINYLNEMDSLQSDAERARKKKEWEEKNRAKRQAARKARAVRGDKLEPGEASRQAAHRQGRGQRKSSPNFRDTRGTSMGHTQDTAATWRKEVTKAKQGTSRRVTNNRGGAEFAKSAHKSNINKMRRQRGASELPEKPASQAPVRRRRRALKPSEMAARARAKRLGTTSSEPKLESAQIDILLKARDILREVTSVGAIGVGPQMTASRAYSTHGANMGKDTVKIQPVDKALRKTEKGKSKKKEKVKKESFELFLDRIINENRETK